MNLLLLVEGAETEPRVYEAWLRARIPALRRVQNVADLTTDGYVLVSGKGYPSTNRRIAGLLQDVDANPGKVNDFWICIDSDEENYEDRYQEVERAVEEAARGTRLKLTNPSFSVRIIVQHCCIETWFLGHDGFLRAGPQSRDLVAFKRFYDVSVDDPEQMGRYPGYVTRQSFHLAYLKAMLAERSERYRYTKQRPGVVLEPDYFQAIRARCERTGHLRSFSRLLEALRVAGDPDLRA
jgi:hypothetical protein